MIVIPVHDAIEYIDILLSQLTNINTCGHEILVVDTNSKNENFILEFPKLILKYPSVLFERISYDCWDSGAYVETYRRYDREKYIFLHDSISILNNNLIVDIEKDDEFISKLVKEEIEFWKLVENKTPAGLKRSSDFVFLKQSRDSFIKRFDDIGFSLHHVRERVREFLCFEPQCCRFMSHFPIKLCCMKKRL